VLLESSSLSLFGELDIISTFVSLPALFPKTSTSAVANCLKDNYLLCYSLATNSDIILKENSPDTGALNLY